MESYKLFMNCRRLRHIKRCNNFSVINPTDVAQHSYFTTMLAMLLIDEFNEYKGSNSSRAVDTELLLRKCLVHDFEEAFTSDIPYTVKHMSSEVSAGLSDGVDSCMRSLIGRYNSVMKSWDNYRRTCKNGVEGLIVAFCDMLELSLYCYEELCIGNRSITPILDNCNSYLDDLLSQVVMELYDKDLNYLKEVGDLDRLLPSISKLRQIVQRNESTNEYVLQYFTVDIS